MKNYGFTASEFIGWVRLVRPGSVLGPQQYYLEEMESELLPQFTERVSPMKHEQLSRKYSAKKQCEMLSLIHI